MINLQINGKRQQSIEPNAAPFYRLPFFSPQTTVISPLGLNFVTWLRLNMRLAGTFGVLALAALTIFGCDKKDASVRGANLRNRGPLSVDGFVVQTSPISEDVEVPGTLLPFEETQIRAEVSGRIVQLDIPE